MKCKKCNISYKNKEKYCEKCGSKLEKEEGKRKENSFFSSIKKYKDEIIRSIIIIVVIMFVFTIGIYITSPSFIAKNYFNAVITNDYDKILKITDKENSDFLNNKVLSEKIKKVGKVRNVKIIDKIVYENEAIITFEYEDDEVTNVASVMLKNKGKKFLIFNDWKVNSGKVATNVSFKLPVDSKVTLDSIDLTKYIKSSDENYVVYTIDAMSIGQYDINITLKDGNVVNEKIDVISDSVYTIENINMAEDKKENLNNLTKALLQNIYQNLLQDKDDSTLNYSSSVKNYYKDLRYYYKKSLNNLTNIDCTDVVLQNAKYNDKGNLVATFRVEYNYGINYQDNHVDGLNRSNITVEFSYDNEYKIENIDLSNMMFPIRK